MSKRKRTALTELRDLQRQLRSIGLRECPGCYRVVPVGAFQGQFRCRDCRLSEQRRSKPVAATGEKECKGCGRRLPMIEFYAHGGTRDGRFNQCIACLKSRAAENRQNKESALMRRKLALMGLDPARLEQLREWQENACAICGRSFDDVKVNIDHDHESGLHRGLLCTRCNSGLGSFGDDPQRLAAAIRYLWEWHVEVNVTAGLLDQAHAWREKFSVTR